MTDLNNVSDFDFEAINEVFITAKVHTTKNGQQLFKNLDDWNGENVIQKLISLMNEIQSGTLTSTIIIFQDSVTHVLN